MFSSIFGNASPKPMQIINIHRPLTSLYAGVAVFAGFKMAAGINCLTILASLTFSLITSNIMVFNDIEDREHDRAKGKVFCYIYTRQIVCLFSLSCAIITALLLITACTDSLLAIYMLCVWLAGLLYSLRFMRKLYITQGVIVAMCSTSPILCGSVHARAISLSVTLVFYSFTVLVLMREFVKDIEDIDSDSGYKRTLPTRKGIPITIATIMALALVVAAVLAASPINSIHMTAYSLVLIEYLSWLAILNPKKCRFIKYGIDLVLFAVLTTILIAVSP